MKVPTRNETLRQCTRYQGCPLLSISSSESSSLELRADASHIQDPVWPYLVEMSSVILCAEIGQQGVIAEQVGNV
jgi:hypothetical protein